MIGKKLGHYRILEKIGAGGMGEVYRAHDEQLERDVALKVLPASSFSDATARARLLREARAAAALNHPHICTIHEVGEAEGQAYIAMELLEGQPLSARLASGALPAEQALRYGLQLADALRHAHERGVIHRDLKSANVILIPEVVAKLLDFGLAKRLSGEELAEATTQSQAALTQPGALVGTLAYMAPEQLRGQPADARSDIWALGVVLYEMAAGVRPFQGQTGIELSSAILNQQAAPLPRRVPLELRAVIERCLERKPERRYQSARELRAGLELVSVPGRAVAGARRGPRRARRGRIRALAVLPLANLSRDPEQEYFADGMTEALISNLAKLGALRVISRTSAMRYKGTGKSLPEIAEELNVDAVVEGSVLRVGDRVRITAQLIHAATDTHLWVESYERDLRDVLVLQSEVARAIAGEIQVAVTPEETRRLASASRVNPEAYEAYLKGRFHEYRVSPEDPEKALRYFNLALEKDPDFALAYTGIADVWGAAGAFGFVPPREAFSKVKAAVLKAVELDDMLAEAHEMLGRFRFFYEWDWRPAEKEFQRAIALSPNSSYVRFGYWNLLRSMSRPAEAQAQIECALQLDPFNFFFQNVLGWHLLDGRRYDDAIGQFRKALETEPNFVWGHWGLWRAFHQKGMTDEALAEAQRFLALLGHREAAEAMGRGYAESGYRAAMSRAAEGLVAEAKLGYVQPLRIARLYAHAEEKDLALDWLDKAYEERDLFLVWLRVDLDWDSLRADPRFQDLVRRMNIPQLETKIEAGNGVAGRRGVNPGFSEPKSDV